MHYVCSTFPTLLISKRVRPKWERNLCNNLCDTLNVWKLFANFNSYIYVYPRNIHHTVVSISLTHLRSYKNENLHEKERNAIRVVYENRLRNSLEKFNFSNEITRENFLMAYGFVFVEKLKNQMLYSSPKRENARWAGVEKKKKRGKKLSI